MITYLLAIGKKTDILCLVKLWLWEEAVVLNHFEISALLLVLQGLILLKVLILLSDEFLEVVIFNTEAMLHPKFPLSLVRVVLLDIHLFIWFVQGNLSHKLVFIFLIQLIKLDICEAICQDTVATS